MVLSLIILLLLVWMVRRWGGSGIVAVSYLFLYSAGRFGLTFMRVDDYYGPFTQAQWISVIIGVPTALMLILYAVGRLPVNVPSAIPNIVRDQ